MSPTWINITVVALAFACFGTAQAFGGSGFIASFVGGLLYGGLLKPHHEELLHAAESIGDTFALLTWVLFGAAFVAALLVLVVMGFESVFGTLILLAGLGLLVYRRIRNRTYRLMKRFSAKVRKMPEVRLIVVRDNQATVVVDRAMAKSYVRINALMDKVNSKRFFGEPFSVVVRDGVEDEEVRTLLAGSGVSYVRDDVLGSD